MRKGVARLKCKHVADLASWYASGELPASKTADVEAHLARCAACRAEMEAMTRSLRALEAPKRPYEPPDVLAAVKREAARPGRYFRPAFAGWAFAGAVVAAAVCALAVWNPFGHVPRETQVAVKPPARDVVQAPPSAAAGTPQEAVHADKARRPARRIRGVRHDRGLARTPELPKPKVEYLIVYVPEPQAPEAESPAEDAPEIAIPDRSSYFIRMTDPAAGEVTTVSVRREIEPGAEPRISLDYTITKIGSDENNDERSLHDEELLVPDSRSIRSSVG